MKFDEMVRLFGNRPWFDFEMVSLLSGEAAACIHTEFYRWRESGKVLELRRGMFTLAKPWRHGSLDGAALAGPLYQPSYLSGLWVLTRCGAVGGGRAGAGGNVAVGGNSGGTDGSGGEFTSCAITPYSKFG